MPTGIEWAEETWNPVTGCTQISVGCENCYARALAKRLQAMGNPKYKNGFEVTFHESELDKITPRQKPKLYFVCSMADLFHRQVMSWQISTICDSMARCRQHRFMILTKRSARMREYFSHLALDLPRAWPQPHVALGTTIENQSQIRRLWDLRGTPAAFRFLSLEPLLGNVDLAASDPEWHKYIDLVIVGGESGPKARPVHPDWVRSIREQCADSGVPFMFKQWGEWAPDCLCQRDEKPHLATPRPEPGPFGYMFHCGKKAAGRKLDGQIHDGSIIWRA